MLTCIRIKIPLAVVVFFGLLTKYFYILCQQSEDIIKILMISSNKIKLTNQP